MLTKTSLAGLTAGLVAVLTVAAPAAAQSSAPPAAPVLQTPLAPVHIALGEAFGTWRAFVLSDLFRRAGLRCLTTDEPDYGGDAPNDCSSSRTNPAAVYSPTNLPVVEIPVVFHVIQSSSGQGNVSTTQINNQIAILNEDYRALSSTPGALGVDTKIQFRLADVDPQGNATTGITRTTNTTWFNDSGSYWNALRWDPNRYLNIYSNNASGALGYVPFLPASGNPGSASDRVVILWSAVGRNAPIGPPYNQGRSATHEVGHYLGLYHTFQGGCGSASCNFTGDLICDTNAESSANFGCNAGSSSCGTSDPVRNYMNYSDDTCMNNFTEEQARRMRCTLDFYRPQLAQSTAPVLGTNYCMANGNSTGVPATIIASGSKIVANNDLTLTASQLPINTVGFFIVAPSQAFVLNAGGSSGNLCVGAPTGRYLGQVGNSGFFGQISIAADLTAVPQPNGNVIVQPGETWNWQCWYRDSILGFATSNFSDGYSVTFQ